MRKICWGRLLGPAAAWQAGRRRHGHAPTLMRRWPPVVLLLLLAAFGLPPGRPLPLPAPLGSHPTDGAAAARVVLVAAGRARPRP